MEPIDDWPTGMGSLFAEMLEKEDAELVKMLENTLTLPDYEPPDYRPIGPDELRTIYHTAAAIGAIIKLRHGDCTEDDEREIAAAVAAANGEPAPALIRKICEVSLAVVRRATQTHH